MGKRKTVQPNRTKKKVIGHADGSDDPNHHSITAHAKAVLSGVQHLKNHFPQAIPSLRQHYSSARGLGILVSPFMNISELLESMVHDIEDCAEEGTKYKPSGDIRAIGLAMPGNKRFLRVVWHCWKRNQETTKAFLKLLEDGYNGGIHATTGEFKKGALVYVLKDPWEDELSPKLLETDHKSLRGFNHNDMGRALVPFKYRAEYDEDPAAFRAKVLNGEIVITETDLPSLLFSDDIDYNEDEDPTKGLGTGHIFLRFLNHEMVGSTGAFGDKPTGSKSSKACNWEVERITARIVASVTVAAWIACSSMSQWGHNDGTVDLVAMHEHIVELLEICGPETDEVLDNIAMAVPYLNKTPKGRRHKPSAITKKPVGLTPAEIAKAKRREKRVASGEPEEVEQGPEGDDDEFGFNDVVPSCGSNDKPSGKDGSDSDSSSQPTDSEEEEEDVPRPKKKLKNTDRRSHSPRRSDNKGKASAKRNRSSSRRG